nr:aldehyde dehydrogenase family protein [Melghirimyces profundicolus]
MGFSPGHSVKCKNRIEVRDPQDDSLIATVPAVTAEGMEKAVKRGGEGAKIAAEMPVHQRVSVLHRSADLVASRREEFATLISREGSKTIREARKEVDRAVETLRISAEEARRIQGETLSFDQMPGSENRAGGWYRFPIGLVGAITPFNDPLNLVAHKVGPAVASGNAVIVKPASFTPLSALKLWEVMQEAGLPSPVFSVVPGRGGEVGDVLVSHPDVRMVSFTGGVDAGREIARKAGIKKLSMELGSNCPAIVLGDADLPAAVESCVSGAFWAAGQNCLKVQRVYIEDSIYADFLERFVSRTRQYRIGDKLSEETDMGPLIHRREAERVDRWVREALDQGATLCCGGERDGAYYSPTVLTDLPEGSCLEREEVFGPVVGLYPVRSAEEAVKRANRSDFGLQAGVFTKNLDQAFGLIRRLEVGGVMVNDSSDYRIDAMPFGGVKQSGLGREGVRFAIGEMTETKVVCFRLGS